jgi:hypothetical protein
MVVQNELLQKLLLSQKLLQLQLVIQEWEVLLIEEELLEELLHKIKDN